AEGALGEDHRCGRLGLGSSVGDGCLLLVEQGHVERIADVELQAGMIQPVPGRPAGVVGDSRDPAQGLEEAAQGAHPAQRSTRMLSTGPAGRWARYCSYLPASRSRARSE